MCSDVMCKALQSKSITNLQPFFACPFLAGRSQSVYQILRSWEDSLRLSQRCFLMCNNKFWSWSSPAHTLILELVGTATVKEVDSLGVELCTTYSRVMRLLVVVVGPLVVVVVVVVVVLAFNFDVGGNCCAFSCFCCCCSRFCGPVGASSSMVMVRRRVCVNAKFRQTRFVCSSTMVIHKSCMTVWQRC